MEPGACSGQSEAASIANKKERADTEAEVAETEVDDRDAAANPLTAKQRLLRRRKRKGKEEIVAFHLWNTQQRLERNPPQTEDEEVDRQQRRHEDKHTYKQTDTYIDIASETDAGRKTSLSTGILR